MAEKQKTLIMNKKKIAIVAAAVTALSIVLVVAIVVVSSVFSKDLEMDRKHIIMNLHSTTEMGAVQLVSFGSPTPVSHSDLKWESLDPNIASVVDGKIVGKKIGRTSVVVHMGDMADTCLVDVKMKVDSVSMNVRTVRIRVDSRVKLKARFFPANSDIDRRVIWTSSDTSVAVVTDRGVVFARNEGSAVITANVDNEFITDCEVSVASIQDWKTEIAKLAQKRGGKVDGKMRFTLIWNDKSDYNEDDLDAHCVEPTGNEISYRNKNSRSGGKLDVDNIHPIYGQKAVENITWNSLARLKRNSVYSFGVHRFSDRGGKSGFRGEIEFDGQVYSYNYRGSWRGRKRWGNRSVGYVPVAVMHVDEDGDLYIENILRPVNESPR